MRLQLPRHSVFAAALLVSAAIPALPCETHPAPRFPPTTGYPRKCFEHGFTSLSAGVPGPRDSPASGPALHLALSSGNRAALLDFVYSTSSARSIASARYEPGARSLMVKAPFTIRATLTNRGARLDTSSTFPLTGARSPPSDIPTHTRAIVPQRDLDRFRRSSLWHCQVLTQHINGTVQRRLHVPPRNSAGCPPNRIPAPLS